MTFNVSCLNEQTDILTEAERNYLGSHEVDGRLYFVDLLPFLNYNNGNVIDVIKNADWQLRSIMSSYSLVPISIIKFIFLNVDKPSRKLLLNKKDSKKILDSQTAYLIQLDKFVKKFVKKEKRIILQKPYSYFIDIKSGYDRIRKELFETKFNGLTATDIRKLFTGNPKLFNDLTVEEFEMIPLTAAQFVMLINRQNAKLRISMSDELLKYIEDKFFIDVLCRNSKASLQARSAFEQLKHRIKSDVKK